jgi:MFS family permease
VAHLGPPAEALTDHAAEGIPGDAVATGAAPPRVRFTALEVPQFRIYWLASALSITGDGMENVIRNWLVWELTRSPLWLGMMVFAHWIPFTFFSLYGGVLADRYDNRKVQLVAQAILLTAALGVAIATLGGFVNEWWIFGLLLWHGFAGAIGNPAQQTLIHDLVGRDRLLSAVSLNSSMRQVTQVIGPLIAGYFLVVLGAGWGFLVNAMTFVPLLVVLMMIRPRHRAAVDRLTAGTRESLAEGLRFLRRQPVIAGIIAIEMVPVIFLGHALNSLMPAFATDIFGVDAVGYVVLLAAGGVGAVLAAVWLAYARVRGRGRLIVGAALAETAAILAFAISRNYALSFLLLIVIGAAGVLTQSLANSAIQLAAPDRLRGRVMGTYSFGTQGLRVVNGPVLGGAAQALASVPVAVGGAAVVVLALLGAIAAALPGLRRLD